MVSPSIIRTCCLSISRWDLLKMSPEELQIIKQKLNNEAKQEFKKIKQTPEYKQYKRLKDTLEVIKENSIKAD